MDRVGGRAGRAGRAGLATIAGASVADAALVLVFVAIGRGSHGEEGALLGFATTAWPFLLGAAVGWIGARAWRNPLPIAPTGVIVWAGAVVVGMLLRSVSGQGVQPSFVIVTAVVLGVFLVGWRALAVVVRRIRSRRA